MKLRSDNLSLNWKKYIKKHQAEVYTGGRNLKITVVTGPGEVSTLDDERSAELIVALHESHWLQEFRTGTSAHRPGDFDSACGRREIRTASQGQFPGREGFDFLRYPLHPARVSPRWEALAGGDFRRSALVPAQQKHSHDVFHVDC